LLLDFIHQLFYNLDNGMIWKMDFFCLQVRGGRQLKFKFKLIYDRQSDGQSVLVSGKPLGSPAFFLLPINGNYLEISVVDFNMGRSL
jgi:hypothetical protein